MSDNKQLTVARLRQLFLEFMINRGYKLIEPDSLISDAFPTTFTVSGGPNFADNYLEKGAMKGENTVVIQHCVRHWDYEHVGDDRHLSFFEMAVTSCFDGYPRSQMFQDHFEFATNVIKLPVERLRVTIFGGGSVRGGDFPADSTARYLWKSLGIPQEHILVIPQEVPSLIAKELINNQRSDSVAREAFVANVVEPVGGPRTELFYDTGTEPKCKPTCLPGFCRCGKFTEFWTSVHYTHFVVVSPHERDRMGEVRLSFEPIKRHEIYAAGFGIERLVQIVNAHQSIYQVDTVAPLVEKVLLDLDVKMDDPQIIRSAVVVAEHIRGITFLIAEGVTKLRGSKNRSRKYEYRRYLNNLFRYLYWLGATQNIALLKTLVECVIKIYGDHYRHLSDSVKGMLDEVILHIKKCTLEGHNGDES